MKVTSGTKAAALAMLLCFVAASDGFAADLPVAPPVAASYYAPPLEYNWGGFYVGLNAGYGFGRSSWSTPGFAPTSNFNVNGALAGGTIGINYQWGGFVAGFEADGDWSGLSGSDSGDPYCVQMVGACQTKQPWLATVRGRFGYAINRLLIFATAGGAFGELRTGLNPPGVYDTSNGVGWTAGAGLEVGITENWTAKLEYLYVDLGNGTCNMNCGAVPSAFGGAVAVPVTVPFTENVVRGGINYRFAF
jgi:outer membrane immunogenic protein